jgi:hypothetical protein
MVFGIIESWMKWVWKVVDTVVLMPGKAAINWTIDVIGKTKNGLINIIGDTYSGVKKVGWNTLDFAWAWIKKWANATTQIIWDAYNRTWRLYDRWIDRSGKALNRWYDRAAGTIENTKRLWSRWYDRAAGTINNTKKLWSRGYDRAAWGITWAKSIGKHLWSKAWDAFAYGKQRLAWRTSTPVMQRASSLSPLSVVRDATSDIWSTISNTVDNAQRSIINLFEGKKAA